MTLTARRLLSACCLLTALLLSGCAQVSTSKAVPVTPSTQPPRAKEYRIGVGDEVEVRFFYAPEIDQTATVRPDGNITLPLMGDVRIAGLTVKEAMAHLYETFQADLKRPENTVNVRSFASRKVYVGGEVGQPGMRPLGANVSVMQAIMEVGGLRDTARMDEVILIRRGERGERQVYSLNLARAVSGEDPAQDVILEAQDLVFVPRSDVADVNAWVDLYIRRNLPIGASATYSKDAGQ